MTSCDKILGIHVDNNLTWQNHFSFLSKKISSYLWLLSKIITYLSTEHRFLSTMVILNHILIIAVQYGAIVLILIFTK